MAVWMDGSLINTLYVYIGWLIDGLMNRLEPIKKYWEKDEIIMWIIVIAGAEGG